MQSTQITIDEMRQFLKAEKGWYEPEPHPGFEHVFEVKVPFYPNAVIKVLTSINKHNGLSRKVGGDAIRVFAVDLKAKKGLHKTIKVLRVKGWKNNLQKAVVSIWRDLRERSNKLEQQTFVDTSQQGPKWYQS